VKTAPSIAVVPSSKRLEAAVRAGGGALTPPETARGLIWADPDAPEALKTLLARCPNIEWVQLPFAGIEPFVGAGVLDSRRHWTCAKGIYGQACAEHVLLLILAASRRLHEHLRRRSWAPASVDEECLPGKHVLVIGAGGIARELVPLLRPLQVRTTVVSRSGTPVEGASLALTANRLPEMMGEADFVVIAAPLTPATQKMFDEPLLSRMRPSAWLINVARGGLIDTDALVRALKRGALAGAALDVTDPEPLPDTHPLWEFDNVIITPHIANTRAMGAPHLAAMVTRNVERFGRGDPLEGPVDVTAGY
jgi:phosphoglycerate dehydrogenase-like enzyme